MTESAPSDSRPVLTIDSAARVTFASAQNAVPILRSVCVHNPSDEAREGLTLTLRAQPGFLHEKTWVIDRLDARADLSLADLDLVLNLEFLSGLNEAERGQLTFELSGQDEVIAQEVVAVEILARDEWGSVGEMAQILAAFVAPNDPAVAPILKEASRILEAAGHVPSLEGYQSDDPHRTYMLSAAIWSAITGMGLSYAEPPTSFEVSGQKVRNPGRIAGEGLATCLDTTLLFAGALEAAALNPVVIFTTGHAFAGVWLREQTLASVVELDITELRKAIAAHEFIPFETTLVTTRPPADFGQAVAEGEARLSEARETEFDRAVDITRARATGIRPMASHREVETVSDDSRPVVTAALPAVPDFGLLADELTEPVPTTPKGRIERWQRKLLDLSLRNRLLNFVETKQTIPFVCPDVSTLEDLLADGKRFRVVSLNEENPVGDRDPELHRRETGEDISETFARSALERGQVCVPLSAAEMEKRLITLYRRAKSDLAEGGTNTLFLAAGFLRWKKSVEDQRTYRAPLLLLPVKLNRRSARSDFTLSHHEDDVRVNATLLQFLERDFELAVPGLQGELPKDESGIDLPLIFETMRAAVRDVPGFEVVEELALSTFSFAKYLMWKDLVDRSDSLRGNRLVKHLIDSPDQVFGSGDGEFPVPTDVDREHSPVDLMTPLPADSSQLSAVLAAASGHDFVIIGPPGTGKSQTIANMIAHCLAIGKTVLFVAEKAAALDVVHRRLKAYGLANACLELHSNKADRRSVIAQLGAAWDRKSARTHKKWIQVNADLEVHRDKLNAYVAALHAEGSHGFSIFNAIGAVAGRQSSFVLEFAGPDAHDSGGFEELESLAERAGLTFGMIAECRWLGSVGVSDWSFAWQTELLARVGKLEQAAQALLESSRTLDQALGCDSDGSAATTHRALLTHFATASARTAAGEYGVAIEPGFEALEEGLIELESAQATVQESRRRLSAQYSDGEIARVPVEELDRDWRQAGVKFWPLSALARRRVRKLLQTYAESGKANPESDIEPLRTLKEALAAVPQSALAGLPSFDGLETDLQVMGTYLGNAKAIRDAIDELDLDPSAGCRSDGSLAEMLGEGGDRGALARVAADYLAVERAFDEACAAHEDHAKGLPEIESLSGLLEALAGIRAETSQLASWSKWVDVRSQAVERGLGPLLDALRSGLVTSPADEFRVAYFTWWLPLALDASAELRGFVHWDHSELVRRFCELDSAAQDLAVGEIRRAVAHGLPARDGVPRKSELGILRHQLGLQRPSASIRGLIADMPETFTQLAPCVLMSPLSVAQYLPTDHAHFDIVIFDEASQITTWDAIGAIARGQQSIIVGDPKQLPPTNFFGRSNDDEDEDLEVYEKDLASILDEASVAGLPLHQLNWHYRSRDESLIAFSNQNYYSNRLVTFPSPSTASDAVVFHKVDGVYARGSGRTNEIEGRAIAAFAVERMKAWLEQPEDERLTLGIITFNVQQQELILDLLDDERRAMPELEWFFDDEREEPVIVKNLENIQGDERDLILFSITFGPDKAGKMTMSFGAINRDGGERRLNVAVTRARAELHIFSSITAEQIDLSRSRARGVADLKGFLDYAVRGEVALPTPPEDSPEALAYDFEASIAGALEERGWEVRSQVGVSGFRIDLAVVHPDNADGFLAGIECDGTTYHSSASARDRDKIREGVLRNLGWQLLRIWSTDWFMNPKEAVDRTDAALGELLARSREEADTSTVSEPDAV